MSLNPVHQIETWTGAVKDYTITDALEVWFKEVITDAIGQFYFTVATKKDNDTNYYYNDIAVNDKVKIWLDYDTITGNPDFVGKIANISAPLNTSRGYIRVVSGFSQGEVLLRRLKRNKNYSAVEVDDIVAEIASDLSLGAGDIAEDTNPVTLEVQTKTYFDLLREISDYWVNAETQIKKDFYVDVDNDLYWKARPFRSEGVETFTVGSNIDDYTVKRDVQPVENNILFYGRNSTMEPETQDEYTDDPLHENWTIYLGGTLSLEAEGKVGSHYVRAKAGLTVEDQTFVDVKFTFPEMLHQGLYGQFSTLGFYVRNPILPSPNKMRIILESDPSGHFYTDIITYNDTGWQYFEFPLGITQTYSDLYPDGVWLKNGSPGWINIKGIEFYQIWENTDLNDRIEIDDLWLKPKRFHGSASNGDSITSYGQRDFEGIDDKLLSNSDCTKRAQTVLYQKKDLPVQIDFMTKGNMNVLVGDRLSLTIPAENITAQPYDVIAVEHLQILPSGFHTKVVTMNSGNIREAIETEPLQILTSLKRQLRQK